MKTLDEFPMFKLMLSAGMPLDTQSINTFYRQVSIWHSEKIAENILSVNRHKSRPDIMLHMESEGIPGFIADKVLESGDVSDSKGLLERLVSDDLCETAFDAVNRFRGGDMSFLPTKDDKDVIRSMNESMAVLAPLFYSYVCSRASVFLSQGDFIDYHPVDIKEKTDILTEHLRKYDQVFDPKMIREHSDKMGKIPHTAAGKRANIALYLRSRGGYSKKTRGRPEEEIDGLIIGLKESYSFAVKFTQYLVDMARKVDEHTRPRSRRKRKRWKPGTAEKEDFVRFSGEELFLTDIYRCGLIKPMGHKFDLPMGKSYSTIITIDTEVDTGDKTKKMNSFARDAENMHESRHKIYIPLFDGNRLAHGFVWDCHIGNTESIILNDFGPLNHYGYSTKKDREYASDTKYGKLYRRARDRLFEFFDACDPWTFSPESFSERVACLPKESQQVINVLGRENEISGLFPDLKQTSLSDMRMGIFRKYFGINDEMTAQLLVDDFPDICFDSSYPSGNGIDARRIKKTFYNKSKDTASDMNRESYKYLRTSTSRIERILSTRDIFDYDMHTGEVVMDNELDEELAYNRLFRQVRILLYNDDEFARNHIQKSIELDNGIKKLQDFIQVFCSETSAALLPFYNIKGEGNKEHNKVISGEIKKHFDSAEEMYENLVFREAYSSNPYRALRKAWVRLNKNIAADFRGLESKVEQYKRMIDDT